jgi:hypothetical protein
MTSTVNITTESDADFYHGFAYQDTTGAPIALTGNTLRMGVRKNAEDIIELMLLTTENGGLVITNAAGGAFTLWIKQADLLQLAPDVYVHSLIRTRPDGLQLQMWLGTLTHTAGPSR